MENEEIKLPEIVVTYADVLTRPLFYPQNAFSLGLADIMRRKTFTKIELEKLQRMGFKVTVKPRSTDIPYKFMPSMSNTEEA